MGLERGLINRQIKGRRLLILRTVNVHYIMYITSSLYNHYKYVYILH